ncbi:MAG: hypothetical protein JWP25_3594 [Bradyrhizobium sp.]|nr:hypothetical protein [Bradyrhizobium sp.]
MGKVRLTEAEELPLEIIMDLTRELHAKVHEQIMLKAKIADHPKDMFRISLGALSASLGAVGGIFSAAYGLPFDPDTGRQIALALSDLGDKARTMTEDEWKEFAGRAHLASSGKTGE